MIQTPNLRTIGWNNSYVNILRIREILNVFAPKIHIKQFFKRNVCKIITQQGLLFCNIFSFRLQFRFLVSADNGVFVGARFQTNLPAAVEAAVE